MGRQRGPRKLRDIERAVRNLGLDPRRRTGSSHVHWCGAVCGVSVRVTVDTAYPEISVKLLGIMARQANLSLDDFLALIDGAVDASALLAR